MKFKDAFEDARMLNNAVQEITSSCEACKARGPLEWVGYGLGQQWCDDDRLGGYSAPRTHRGAMRCGANVEEMKDKFNLKARSLTSPSCCAVTHVLAVAQLSVYTEENACSRHDHHFARCLSKVTELITSGGARTGFICEVSDFLRCLDSRDGS